MLPEIESYFEATREFDRGELDQDLWTRALDICSGDKLAAKHQYITLRADALSAANPLPTFEDEPESPFPNATTCPEQAVPSPARVKQVQVGSPAEPLQPAPAPQTEWSDEDEDEQFFQIAVSEFQGDMRDEKTWRVALMLADGDAAAARHHYICLRMDHMRAMSSISQVLEQSGT